MSSYPELRNKIAANTRRLGLRLDWVETTKTGRHLLIWNAEGVIVARVMLPYRMTIRLSAAIVAGLEPIFGKDWNK